MACTRVNNPLRGRLDAALRVIFPCRAGRPTARHSLPSRAFGATASPLATCGPPPLRGCPASPTAGCGRTCQFAPVGAHCTRTWAAAKRGGGASPHQAPGPWAAPNQRHRACACPLDGGTLRAVSVSLLGGSPALALGARGGFGLNGLAPQCWSCLRLTSSLCSVVCARTPAMWHPFARKLAARPAALRQVIDDASHATRFARITVSCLVESVR